MTSAELSGHEGECNWTLGTLRNGEKRLGYNQFEAAERLGVHRGAVQNWEREVRPIPLTVVLACEEIEREHQSLN